MKIGIMGGTFDPIHIGHLMLGEFAHEDYDLDEVWFLPNGNPPHKEIKLISTTIEHRLAMTKLAIKDTPYFKIHTYELDHPGVHYSYKTMEHFIEEYPEHTFYFIIGADSLFSLYSWCHPERLLKSCTILAAFRDEKNRQEMNNQIDLIKKDFHADIQLLEAPMLEISSSNIRERVQQGKTIHYMVSDVVANYISKHNLYHNNESVSGE